MSSWIQQEPHDDGLASLRRYVQEGGSSIESMRLLSRQQLAKMEERIVVPVSELQDAKMAIVRSLKSQPIAKYTDELDSKIYEADIELWKLRLGPRMKISAGHWPQLLSSAWSLAKAEIAMLKLYVERAQIEDGQDILDLGCGYGSTALYLAERFPHCRIVAITITASHIDFLKTEMARRGLTNIVPRLADINITGEESYLSADVLHYFQRNLTLLDQWWVNGKHYAATLDAWLEQLSANRDCAMTLLRARYGDKEAEVEYRKIEWYLWVGSEEFAFKDGNALGLSHYLFCKTEVGEMPSTEPFSMIAARVEGVGA